MGAAALYCQQELDRPDPPNTGGEVSKAQQGGKAGGMTKDEIQEEEQIKRYQKKWSGNTRRKVGALLDIIMGNRLFLSVVVCGVSGFVGGLFIGSYCGHRYAQRFERMSMFTGTDAFANPCTDIWSNCIGLSGDDLWGDLDACDLSDKDRADRVEIGCLIGGPSPNAAVSGGGTPYTERACSTGCDKCH